MGLNIVIATVSLILIGVANSSMVYLMSEWKPNFGWEITCSWNLFANDSLQSVRLSNVEQEFMLFRPERDGVRRSALTTTPVMDLHTDCHESQDYGITGICVISVEVFQPIKTDMITTCEVSGERPYFRTESKSINVKALVPPSGASLEKINENQPSAGRVNVNCTTTGLPAPVLVWNIGDQKVSPDFSGGKWNATSKLYDVWSSLSYTPGDSNSHATCTPEIHRGGQLLRGTPALYSTATSVKDFSGAAKVIIGVFSIILLTR